MYDKETDVFKFTGVKDSKTLTYSFNEDMLIGNEKVNFSGIVNKPVVLKEKVIVPDENLRNAILETLNKPKDYKLTNKDLLELTSLTAVQLNIKNIEGLQYCKNLKFLKLLENDITDISYLSSLLLIREIKDYKNTLIKLGNVSKDLK